MKYIVKSNEIDTFNSQVEDIINNEITPTVSIMDKLAKKTLWEGIACDAFTSSYDDTMKEIDKIPNYLYLYNKFLNDVINGYGDAFDELKKELEKLEDELEESGDLDEQGLL